MLQDILFRANIHPRRRLESMSGDEKAGLLAAVTSVLGEMETAGGRDTEKDIYGQPGRLPHHHVQKRHEIRLSGLRRFHCEGRPIWAAPCITVRPASRKNRRRKAAAGIKERI